MTEPFPFVPEVGDPVPLAAIESRHIKLVLDSCRGNRKRAAAILEIGERTLYRKLAEIVEAEERKKA